MQEEPAAGILSPAQWRRHVAELAAGGPLDVVVVGGGLVGAGAALDAASRGLHVGLLEASDWGCGASGRPGALALDGISPLRLGGTGLVAEALVERAHLLDTAPGPARVVRLVRPLRHRPFEGSRARVGPRVLDRLARRSGTGIGDHERLSRRQTLTLAPSLRAWSVAGGVAVADVELDGARLAVALVRSAVARGALAASRSEVVGLVRHRGAVAGVVVRLAESGEELTVRARSVVVATGAWTGGLGRRLGFAAPTRPVVKAAHVVVRREAIAGSAALALARRGWPLFVLPCEAGWLIGATSTPWAHDAVRPLATASDVDELLAQASRLLARRLRSDDVVSAGAALRPRPGPPGPGLATGGGLAAVARPAPGLVVVSGGGPATYRLDAARAVDEALAVAGLPPTPSLTRGLRLVADDAPTGGGATPGGREVAGAPGLTRARVVHAVTHEGARRLDDVLARRTKVARGTADRGVHAANEVAALMAGPLGWSAASVRREVEAYRRTVAADRVAEAAGDDEAAVAAVAAIERRREGARRS